MSRLKPVYSYRTVKFTPDPRQNEEKWESFFDLLPETFWEGWRHRVFGTLGVSSTGAVVDVGGWPWWMPAFVATRMVAKVARQANIGGEITYVVELVVDYDPDDQDTRLYMEHLKSIWEARGDGSIPDFVRVHSHDRDPMIAEEVFGQIGQDIIDRIHAEEAEED